MDLNKTILSFVVWILMTITTFAGDIEFIIDCRANQSFSFWIYFSFDKFDSFGKDHTGIFINGSNDFKEYNLKIPENSRGLKVAFYSLSQNVIEIRNIKIKRDTVVVFVEPDDIYTDFWWSNVDSLKINNDYITLHTKKDDRGIAPPQGFLFSNSLRKYYINFFNEEFLENNFLLELKNSQPLFIKLWFKEHNDLGFYKYDGIHISSSEEFRSHQFEIYSSGPIMGVKLDFGNKPMKGISLKRIDYETKEINRYWKGNKITKYFQPNPLVDVIKNSRQLVVINTRSNDLMIAYMVYDRELVSRFDEIKSLIIWYITFALTSIFLLTINIKFFAL